MNLPILRFAIAAALALCASPTQAWKQSYPQPERKYPIATTALDAKFDDYWAKTWKTKFLADGLVKASDSGTTPVYTSEGQAYGLLLSLWMNDEPTFRAIYAKTQALFWNADKGWYGSELDSLGTKLVDSLYYGSANIDIAGALISASALVDAGKWTDATPSYKAQAKILLNNSNAYLPKDYRLACAWPGSGSIFNPSHQLVHWYTVFKQFSASNGITGHDWDSYRFEAYRLFKAQPNSAGGMVRNWSDVLGTPSGCARCVSTPGNDDMGFDAVRIPWRIGLDAAWHRDSSAYAWIRSTWSKMIVDPKKPGMYRLNSSSSLWGWCDSAQAGCTPSYDRILTRAMWGASAAAARDSSANAQAALNAILPHFVNNAGNDYIGEVPAGATDSVRNRFTTQTLGLFGLLAMTGNAPDIWGDLKNKWTPPDTSARIEQDLRAYPDTILVGGTTRLVVHATKPVHWVLRYKPRSSGAQGTWTSFFSSPLWRTVDSIFAIKGLVVGYKAGDTLDLQAFWIGGSDTSTTVLHVVGPTTSAEPRTARLASFARLEGALLVLPHDLDLGSLPEVRFLSANGSVVWTTRATPSPEGLLLDHPPVLRGIHVFEVVTPSRTIRGRFFSL